MTVAVTLLHVAIAIATIAIIVRGQRWPWYAAVAFGAIGPIGALSQNLTPCSWADVSLPAVGRKNPSISGVTLADVCCIRPNSHHPSGSISGRHLRWLLCWLCIDRNKF